jgi:hypothetical protein
MLIMGSSALGFRKLAALAVATTFGSTIESVNEALMLLMDRQGASISPRENPVQVHIMAR